uniref:C2H2-type domain-containing protein n=1 Tax=Mycena chlorophos TaxID=658473 RepID=A0ABQ0L038_MYCCL|nr:predicted protein [Mycena chlorophos]
MHCQLNFHGQGAGADHERAQLDFLQTLTLDSRNAASALLILDLLIAPSLKKLAIQEHFFADAHDLRRILTSWTALTSLECLWILTSAQRLESESGVVAEYRKLFPEILVIEGGDEEKHKSLWEPDVGDEHWDAGWIRDPWIVPILEDVASIQIQSCSEGKDSGKTGSVFAFYTPAKYGLTAGNSIVADPANASTIKFMHDAKLVGGPSGAGIVILKPHKFLRDIVPAYLPYRRLEPFYCLLQRYGFRRKRFALNGDEGKAVVLKHPIFTQKNFDLPHLGALKVPMQKPSKEMKVMKGKKAQKKRAEVPLARRMQPLVRIVPSTGQMRSLSEPPATHRAECRACGVLYASPEELGWHWQRFHAIHIFLLTTICQWSASSYRPLAATLCAMPPERSLRAKILQAVVRLERGSSEARLWFWCRPRRRGRGSPGRPPAESLLGVAAREQSRARSAGYQDGFARRTVRYQQKTACGCLVLPPRPRFLSGADTFPDNGARCRRRAVAGL